VKFVQYSFTGHHDKLVSSFFNCIIDECNDGTVIQCTIK